MSKYYCERVEKRANQTIRLVNNEDFDKCKVLDDETYAGAIKIMDDRYKAVTGQLGTSACGNVVDAYLKGTKVSDEDYNMCKMVGKNISMSLEYARGEYYGKCDDDKKDVSRTDYTRSSLPLAPPPPPARPLAPPPPPARPF